ncbi:hypothetical protein EKI60_04995 [Candidatus Saccharibacteria bacterium]|nr:MAG: hypothetical protein EKI60_04995 [Candidatus Saccharibacteria bacterium]
MKKQFQHTSSFVYRVLGTMQFFWASLVIFVCNAAWIAISGLYPMAHDEQFHLGIIRLYTERLSPFWSSMPAGEATYGAVTRDPSYLYHYFLSFPFRLLDNIVQSEVGQVIVLRFVSIAFVVSAIWIIRKVLQRAGFSKQLTHLSLFIFAITPLVSFFAAQVNYDTLLFLMLALALLYGQKVLERLRTSQKLDTKEVSILFIILAFGSLVKYAYLPIAIAVVGVIGWRVYRLNLKLPRLWQSLVSSFKKLSTQAAFALLALVVLFFGLAVERYGVNTIKYKTPTPECNQVLSVEACMAYSPWRRNYLTKQSYQQGRLETTYTSQNFPRYVTTIWLSKTTEQLFFSISGMSNSYKIARPYRAPRIASVTLMLVGFGLFLWHFKRIRSDYHLDFLLAVPLVYLGALLSQNYLDFLNIGYPYAIQGRYLIPILPIVYVLVGQSFASSLRKYPGIKASLAVLAILLFTTQGGGAATFISRSNTEWWWPNQKIIRMNQAAKRLIDPIIISR